MPKHQVIRDVGQSLLGVLRAELSAAKSKAKAYLAAPSAEFLRKSAPCLVLYLYDLKPAFDVRPNENWQLEEEIVDERGEMVVVRYGRPLELGLHYMVTAAADDLADEHEILALGLRGFLDHAKITGDQLVGDSFFKGDAVRVTHDPPNFLRPGRRRARRGRLPRRGAALLRQGAGPQPPRARAPHRRFRSPPSTPRQRQRQGAGGGGEATEDRGLEEVSSLAGVVRRVVNTKRKQMHSPTRDRLPCAASNHRTEEE